MENFVFHAYTKMLFGKGQLAQLPALLRPYGNNVLLTYGGGSIKRNGIYDAALSLLDGFAITELSGIAPNPRIESVREGVALCREHHIDVVLAIGGGSTLDCSKVIAAGAYYDGDAWDLVTNPEKIGRVLPLVTVLTLAATGSEMNGNAVITNFATQEKLGTFSPDFVPQATICDPTYMNTLPAKQTAAGTADIMSHVLESYFQRCPDAFVQDKFSEGLLQACIRYCPVALQKPDDYAARANLAWASSMALNGLCGAGKSDAWSCHPIEHELSAYYDITHGEGLAIVTPHWMRHVLRESTVDRFVDYAVNVWQIAPSSDKFETARQGIDATARFFADCGIPATLSAVGIGPEKLREMAEAAVVHGGLQNAYVPLDADDVLEILTAAL